ncbi:MAG: hypothetical protein WCI04_02505 [archaeon]
METNKNLIILIAVLFCILLLLIIPGVPFTNSQFINQSTDLNYILFANGFYNGKILSIDNNLITAIDNNGNQSFLDTNWQTNFSAFDFNMTNQYRKYNVNLDTNGNVTIDNNLTLGRQIFANSKSSILIDSNKASIFGGVRGLYSTDISSYRIADTEVCSEQFSTCLGWQNTGLGNSGTQVGGVNNLGANASSSTQLGVSNRSTNQVTSQVGFSNTLSGDYSAQLGSSLIGGGANSAQLGYNYSSFYDSTASMGSGKIGIASTATTNLLQQNTWIYDVTSLGAEDVNCSGFDTNTDLTTSSCYGAWTYGTRYKWNANGSLDRNITGTTTALSQAQTKFLTALTVGNLYLFSYTITNFSAPFAVNGITPSVAGVTFDKMRTNGVYQKAFIALNSNALSFALDGIQGARFNIDNVSIKPIIDGNLIVAGNIRTNKDLYVTGNVNFDGNVNFNNTYWDDISVSINGSKTETAKPPLFDETQMAYYFENVGAGNEQYVFGEFELPHGWKLGTNLHCHLHLHPSTNDVNDANFELSYNWTNIGAIEATPTTITLLAHFDGNVNKTQIVEFPDINGSGKTLSSLVEYRLKRLSSATNDTFTGNVYVDNLGCHAEFDAIGSREEWIK